MSSCKKAVPSRHQCNNKPPSSGKKRLSELVEEYLQNWGDFYQNEAQWWGNQTLDWKSAQKRAWESRRADGKMSRHQHRVGSEKLKEGLRIALIDNIQSDRFETFEQLYEWVKSVAHQVDGLGELVTYDVALRLGMWLNLEPAVVYLHRGTRDGAKKFNVNVKEKTATVSAFPPEMQELGATHAENFLCIYKEHLG
ncbi:MAG: hypothetical protein SXA11_05865 [Cyanobacteriota bacterium]|nr:hypothetical protein [Cyanobacteriota bacterium]